MKRNSHPLSATAPLGRAICLLSIASAVTAIALTEARATTISVVTTDFTTVPSGATTGTLSGFQIANNPDRMLAVMVGGEGIENISSVSYGAQNLSHAVTRIHGGGNAVAIREVASIWYLPAPATGIADIIVTGTDPQNGWAIGAISLHNVAQSAPFATAATSGRASNAGPTQSLSFTTNFPNALTVEAFAKQFDGGPTTGSGQTNVFATDLDGGAHFAGYLDTLPAPGTHTQSLTGLSTGVSHRNAYVGVVFAPIPEPSSALLLMSAMLGFVLFRRRT